MLHNQPTDKNGYLILLGDLVYFSLPKSKKIANGKVVEIIDEQKIRIEVDQIHHNVFDKYIICNAQSVTDIYWNRMQNDFGNPTKSNFIDTQKLSNNLKFKSIGVKKEIRKLQAEFEMELCEYQQIVRNKVSIIQNIARKLNSHSNILEVGDIVIWCDGIEKFFKPFLCQIEDPLFCVKYRILDESLKPGGKVYSRYEHDAGILYHFHEKKFRQLIKKHNIYFYDDFMKFAKSNCTPFNDEYY